MGSKKRSLAKTLTWRALTATMFIFVTYYLTNDWIISGKLTLWYQILQTILFYIHERIWHRIKF